MDGASLSNGLSLRGITRRFGVRLAVDGVSLDAPRGRVLCLLGKSGCGKSTTLRIAAGLERPDSGEVYIGGKLVEGQGVFVPPETRRVGLMFQDYALFPHLTAKANVAFGLARLPKAERETIAEYELDRVGLLALKDAYPHTLSGGEQQRVALARMLAPKPDVVLMDEPFSGLDAALREEVRGTTLKRLLEADAAVVMVTHDPEEAMRAGDSVALMESGHILQTGTPADIYRAPASRAAAALFGGVNVFRSSVISGCVHSPFGVHPAPGMAEGAAAEIIIRPSAIQVAASGAEATLLKVRPNAGGMEIEARLFPLTLPGEGELPILIRAGAPAAFGLAPGALIRLAASPGEVFVFPCPERQARA